MSFITGVPALITIGHDHLDFSNRITAFNASISYVFYIIHFPIVVICQYFLSLIGVNAVANFFLTIIISYTLTVGLWVLIKKTRITGALFGLKVNR